MSPSDRLLEIVGPTLMEKICAEFGGERIYIPARVPDPNRDHTIISIFDESLRAGATVMSSYQRAAEAAGISVRRTQEIVARI